MANNVFDLLQNLYEVIRGGTKVPMLNKVMIDPKEALDIIKDIQESFPSELNDAKIIRENRTKLLADATAEYERIISTAEAKATELIETDEITLKAKERADAIMTEAAENSAIMKRSILDYTDLMLYNLQEKVDSLYNEYFSNMYTNLQESFNKINANIAKSRDEIKDKMYEVQMEDANRDSDETSEDN